LQEILEAIIFLKNISRQMNNYEECLFYLKKLKELPANIIQEDIDKQIKEVMSNIKDHTPKAHILSASNK
jgi:hypothetical protein